MNFSDLYLTYYSKLVRFAKKFVEHEEDAENITQDVFADLWEKRDFITYIENMNAYLFRLVRNRCLDYLRHKMFEQKYAESLQLCCEENAVEDYDTEIFIRAAINSLPKRCRDIFLLSRVEGLKYREISEHLGISVNTVECQMGIALKKLRMKLDICLAA